MKGLETDSLLSHRTDSLSMLDPATEAQRAASRGLMTLLTVCGLTCEAPGLMLTDYKNPRIVAAPRSVLDPTGDAFGIGEQRFKDAAFEYALAYNRVILTYLRKRRRRSIARGYLTSICSCQSGRASLL